MRGKMAMPPVSEKNQRPKEILLCIQCSEARFPEPNEQCYKFGGMICNLDQGNVGKYDRCRFGYTRGSIPQKLG